MPPRQGKLDQYAINLQPYGGGKALLTREDAYIKDNVTLRDEDYFSDDESLEADKQDNEVANTSKAKKSVDRSKYLTLAEFRQLEPSHDPKLEKIHPVADVDCAKTTLPKYKFIKGHMGRRQFKCQEKFSDNGEIVKCQYHARSGEFKKQHRCQIFIPSNRYNKQNNSKKEKVDTYKKLCRDVSRFGLDDHVAQVSGVLNIPINVVNSMEFRALMEHSFREGQKHPCSTFDAHYPIHSSETVTKRMIEVSHKVLLNELNMCSKNYSSLGLDAATYGNFHFLETAIIDPCTNKPLLYDSFPIDSLDFGGYRNMGQKICEKIAGNNISLLAFVGDNLRSQVAGLGHWKKNSLQQTNDKYSFILFINCCCHSFNRAVVDTMEKCPELKDYIENLNTIIVLLRKQEMISLIKLVAKSLVDTRWVYIFDASYFLIKHKDIINSKIREITNSNKHMNKEKYKFIQGGIPDYIQDIMHLFYPVKLLITVLSSDWAKLWHLYPLYMEALSIFEKEVDEKYFMDEKFVMFAQKLKENIRLRYYNTCRVELAQAAYLLTKNGRYDYRLKNDEITQSADEERNGEEPKLMLLDDDPHENEYQAINHDLSREEADDLVTTRQKFITSYEGFSEAKLMRDRKPKTSLSLWGNIQSYIHKSPYIQLLYVIENFSKTKKQLSGHFTDIKNQLDKWLNEEDSKLCFIEILKDSPLEYWKIMMNDDEYKYLATVAMILLSLPASEAQCERLISKHRKAVNEQQKSMKCETAAARVRLSSTRIPARSNLEIIKIEKFIHKINKINQNDSIESKDGNAKDNEDAEKENL